MKILFLSAYFEPEVIPSSYLGIDKREALAKAGYEMIVYTPMPTRGISDDVRYFFKQHRYEEKFDGLLKIYRFPMFREPKNTYLRALRYLFCNIIHFFIGVLHRNIDVICVASTPPTQGALAGIIKFFINKPVIYDLQDIFPDSLVNAGLTKKGSIFWNIGRVIEDFSYKHANKIIVISDDLKHNIIEKGVPDKKISIIHNWADESSIVNIPRSENPLFDTLALNRDKYYITYCGNIGFSQNFDLLVNVANRLLSSSEIAFLIFGDGPYKPSLEKKLYENHINNIHLFPYQPYRMISQVFSIGDAYLIISKANIGKNSVPSKTWNIMAAEKPIIASFDQNSEIINIICRANCGISVPPDDEEALQNAITQLFSNPQEAINKGKNGRKYIEENLSKKTGISQYLKLFDEYAC